VLIAVAMFIATPIAWYSMNRAGRLLPTCGGSFWIFILAGLAAIAIAH